MLNPIIKLLLKVSFVFLLVTLLILISIANFDNAAPRKESTVSGPRVLARTVSPVVSYVNAIGHCMRLKTRIGVAQQTRKALEELWRILPTVSDQCSVNAQISLRSYPTSGSYNVYFIQNMNTTLVDSKCTVVSMENARNAEVEERLLADNDKCRLLAIDDKRAHNESERIRHLPLSMFTAHDANTPNDGVDVMGMIGNRVGGIVDLMLIGSETKSNVYANLLLTEPNDVIVCQVNLLYHEPRNDDISQFIDLIRTLLNDERYVLMRADRDRQSLNMLLFFVNHQDQYCLDRYLRMYSFD